MNRYDGQRTLDELGDYMAAASRRQVPATKMWRHSPIGESHGDENAVVYSVRTNGTRTGGGIQTVTMSSDANGGRRVRWSGPGGYICSARPGFNSRWLTLLFVRGSEVSYEPDEGRRAQHAALGKAAVAGADGWFISAVADDVSTSASINALSDWGGVRVAVQEELYWAYFGNITPVLAQTVEEARANLNARLADGARLCVALVLGQTAAFAGMQTPEEWLSSRPADPEHQT